MLNQAPEFENQIKQTAVLPPIKGVGSDIHDKDLRELARTLCYKNKLNSRPLVGCFYVNKIPQNLRDLLLKNIPKRGYFYFSQIFKFHQSA